MTGLTQSNVSGHLNCLKDCGLVTSRQEGRFIHYRLADPEVTVVLTGAEAILSRLADRITACLNCQQTLSVSSATAQVRLRY